MRERLKKASRVLLTVLGVAITLLSLVSAVRGDAWAWLALLDVGRLKRE